MPSATKGRGGSVKQDSEERKRKKFCVNLGTCCGVAMFLGMFHS